MTLSAIRMRICRCVGSRGATRAAGIHRDGAIHRREIESLSNLITRVNTSRKKKEKENIDISSRAVTMCGGLIFL